MNEENVAAKSPLDPRDPDRAALEHAVEVMTAHAEGLLEIDEQSLTIKYVIDPLTGRLVASVPVAVLLSGQHLLWVPEESLDALQLLLSAD
ncbi:MAG: hypothetical protein SFZ24_08170, partial [Planctomycetota bacterium]|nr:hypothetical protein [Planctomycetota bacterium]